MHEEAVIPAQAGIPQLNVGHCKEWENKFCP
jgi:hypothetical protein